MFDELFKFKVNQDLRHKGDTKSYSADMGLLVLHRLFYESINDEGQRFYERSYICRLVKFSGSGETAQFKEHELLTVGEYERAILDREAEHQRMRNEARQIQKEIYAAFGVSEENYLFLKDENGNAIKDKKYRITGFSLMDKNPKLILRESMTSLDKKVEGEEKEVTSKEQFEIVS